MSDPLIDSVVSLCHFDEADGATQIVDQVTARSWNPNAGNAVTSHFNPEYGPGSFDAPADGDYVVHPEDSAMSLADDFCLEISVWIADFSDQCGIYHSGLLNSNDDRFQLWVNGSGFLKGLCVNGGATEIDITGTTVIPTSQWIKVCMEKDGLGLTIYLNGAVEAAGTMNNNWAGPLNGRIGVARAASATKSLKGYADEFRLTKAVRYGGNYAIATGPFPDPGTDSVLQLKTPDGLVPILPRARWLFDYVPGQQAERMDMVNDQGWLMVARTQTTDRAAPQPDGIYDWRIADIIGEPSFTTQTTADNVHYSGIRFTTTLFGEISAYRWYCPDVSGTFTYEVWVNEVGVRVTKLIGPLVPAVVGWQEIPFRLFRSAGTVFDLVVVARSVVQPSSFSSLWQTKNENSNPSDGEAIFRNNQTEIRVANTDENDIDQSANLATIEIGATLSFAGLSWTVTNITTNGSGAGGRHNFFIEPDQGRPEEGDYILTWEWGAADPIPYVEDANHLASDPNVEGFQGTTFPATVFDDNAYGVDVLVEEYIPSPDWDVMYPIN